jgi:aspartyl protease family protein
LGTFSYPITLVGPSGETTLDSLVDTGATYSVVPTDVLQRLDVRSIGKRRFALADERVVEYDVGSVTAKIDGEAWPTLCVFGAPGSEPILGALTLETFLLSVDPVNKRLVPVNGKLKSAPN